MSNASSSDCSPTSEHGRGAPRDAIVIGPRGNGKTALLRWFQQEIEAGAGADVVWLTPSDVGDLDSLATGARATSPLRVTAAGNTVVLDWHRPAGLGARRSAGVVDEIADGALQAETARDAARRGAQPGRARRERSPERKSVRDCRSPVPVGFGRYAGASDAPERGIGDILESRETDRRRPAGRHRRRCRPDPPVRETGPARHIRSRCARRGRRGDPRLSLLRAVVGRRLVERRQRHQRDVNSPRPRRGGQGPHSTARGTTTTKIGATSWSNEVCWASPRVSRAPSVARRRCRAASCGPPSYPRGLAARLPARCGLEEGLASVGYVWRRPGAGNRWEPGLPNLMTYVEAASAQSP